MKKILNLLILLGLCISLVGCGGNSKSPEETREAIEKYTDKVFIDTFNWADDYRDSEGNCYNHDGVKKSCGRIKGEIKDYYSLIIMKDEESIDLSIIVDGEVSSVSYSNDEASFISNGNDKIVSFSEDNCKYIISGNDDTIDEEDLCDSSKKAEAEKIQKSYENMLSKINITEKELKEFASWHAKNDGKKIIENLKEEKKNQKPLTNDEIKGILSKDYTFSKLDDKSIYMVGSSNELMFIPKNSDHQDAFIFKAEIATKDVTLYIYRDGNYIAADDNNKCNYSINDKKIINDSDCSSNTITNIDILKFQFDNILENNGITLDELFNFFINYK